MTLIAVIGILPYVALQLKAIAIGFEAMTAPVGTPHAVPGAWWRDSTFYIALVLVGFTIAFGTRHLEAEVFLKMIPLLAGRGIHTLAQARAAAQQTYFSRINY